MNTFDDDHELEFFAEPPTRESAARPGRRQRLQRGGQRSPAAPGGVGLARLAGLVALGIAVVVGFVFWVGSCGGQSKHDEYASYLSQVAPLAQSSARIGNRLASEIDARGLTLAGLEAKLEGWSRQEQQNYVAAQRIVPPGPLQSAHAQILDAFQLRALGLAGIADTLAQAKSASTPPSTATVASELASQAQLFSSSDIVWTELFRLPTTDTLARQGVTGVIVPGSQFVTNPDMIGARSFSILYQRLGSGSGSGGGGGNASGIHGSALIGTQATVNGKSTSLSTTTATTVSVNSSLVVGVTFLDSGNYPEVRIPVTVKVLVAGRSVYSDTQTVDSILPKHQTTVSFSNLQVPPAAFGQSAKISVTIGKVPGEARLDNNSATYPVLFRLG